MPDAGSCDWLRIPPVLAIPALPRIRKSPAPIGGGIALFQDLITYQFLITT
jgi:hypothetical protein